MRNSESLTYVEVKVLGEGCDSVGYEVALKIFRRSRVLSRVTSRASGCENRKCCHAMRRLKRLRGEIGRGEKRITKEREEDYER